MSMFWVDERAQAVEARHPAPYVVSDWKTPSGRIHVGALRGVVLHDAMARALRSRGDQVRYVYGFEDHDPFDGIPASLDQVAYTPYLGRQLRDVPAPQANGQPSTGPVTAEHNFARVYADEFRATYKSLGVACETIFVASVYARGDFNEAIRLILDHRTEVAQAFEAAIQHREAERAERRLVPEYPINVRCEACGKISTTEVTDWDGQQVSYRCRDGVVDWAAGCGHAGRVSPFDGNAKLPWKIEWAAKWFVFGTDIEGAGKDHYTKGGSHDVAAEVFRRVFAPAAKPGYQQVPEDLFYEWLYLGGAKMSTSKGVGQAAADVAAQIPPELLRFLILRTRPRTAVQYAETPDALPDLYDDYDRLLTAYWDDPAGSDGQLFDLVRLKESGELPGYTMRFRKAVSIVQQERMTKQPIAATAAAEKGLALTATEAAELEQRTVVAERWLERYEAEAPTETELTEEQRRFLDGLADQLDQLEDWTPEAIQAVVQLCRKSTDIPARQAFGAIYRVFLGADSGPQAGSLLAAQGREPAIKRLRDALQ